MKNRRLRKIAPYIEDSELKTARKEILSGENLDKYELSDEEIIEKLDADMENDKISEETYQTIKEIIAEDKL